MKNLGYYNGKIDLIENMMIPMSDRSHWFGDGVYEASSVRNHKIMAIDEHINRFFNSARLLKIKLGITKEDLKTLLNDLVNKVDEGDCFLYWQATRGAEGERLHAYNPELPANLWVTITPKKITPKSKEFTLTHTEDTRFLHCNIKTLNLIPTVMAVGLAKERGTNETVFHRGNIVTECAHSNIHILKDGKFITHPADEYILPGIARMRLLRACERLGIPFEERPFTMLELANADEVIISSSSVLCTHAISLDGMEIGGKDSDLYHKLQDYIYDEWEAETSL